MKKHKIINSLIIISLTLIFSASYSFAQARIRGPIGERGIERQIEPDYPEWAQKQGIEGEVEIKCWVLPSGEVRNVEIWRTSGWLELDECACQALMKWKFSSIKGEEIQWDIVPFKFKLE